MKKILLIVGFWYLSNALYTALPAKFKPPFKDTE
jgi:hypothetical protein